jgi:serpin B
MKQLFYLGLLLTLSLIACESNNSNLNDSDPQIQLPEPDLDIIHANQLFALEIFKESNRQTEETKNIILSPFSISTAVSMVYNGANGQTQKAMQNTLEFEGLSLEKINKGNMDNAGYLANVDPYVTLHIANAIFWDENLIFPFNEFISANETYYDAELSPMSFGDPAALPTINGWVNDKTNGKIEEILKEIRSDEVMFLINALYFKGDWRFPFDPEDTKSNIFTLPDETTIQADYMNMTGSVIPYANHPLYEAIDLAYGDSIWSMTLVLPRLTTQLVDLVGAMDIAFYSELTSTLSAAEVNIQIPKFELAYSADLKDILSLMGMEIAFDEGEADFTKLGQAGGNIYLSRVKHKTYIKVDEIGTEAAAVTAVGVGVESATPTLIFNRPFIFLIRERESGAILFLGKIVNPLEEEE